MRNHKFLIFYISAFILFLTYFFQITVFAQNNTSESSASAKVEYILPYPGALPDSPIYFLKALRDRLVSYLINDPLKKAEFNLLTSDKRANAALYLADHKKYELSITSFSKSTNYFIEGVAKLKEAIDLEKDGKDVLERMKLAVVKHQEVLQSIGERSPKEFTSVIEYETKRLIGISDAVNSLDTKK
jgi:hypothetical protein